MKRRVLLLEPNYKNKYPPLNLMKLATYFREVCRDDVRFFKGDLKHFAAQLLLEEFFEGGDSSGQILLFEEESPPAEIFTPYAAALLEFIKTGKNSLFDDIPNLRDTQREMDLRRLHRRFKIRDFPKFDIICVATLFTFEWARTVDTINSAKKFLATGGQIHVGGVAATLVPEAIKAETGIAPHVGLLDKPDALGKTDSCIIDDLPPDYSILDEIDYAYPASDAYLAYTTRGCIRRCNFCAVSRLEPTYKNFVGIRAQLARAEEKFGARKTLLLLDNNVLASASFDAIIDEIKACGFARGATYIPPNEYAIAVRNLRDGYNDRAYTKKIFRLYAELARRLPDKIAAEFDTARANIFTKPDILAFDGTAAPLFERYLKRAETARYVDFNQGLDARLLTEEKMSRLAEINIHPMRIAFDHIEQREIYERAIRLAASHGITVLSNYILYNFNDAPDDLYARLRINVDLCDELGVNIYSFPMKFHPITDPKFFRNRDYIGRNWNRKFIRAVQAILNATKGKVGRGRDFFEAAFGRNIDEFRDLLWMPEAMIIHREKYSALAEDWRAKFHALDGADLAAAKNIIATNKFAAADASAAVREVLAFYKITRDRIKEGATLADIQEKIFAQDDGAYLPVFKRYKIVLDRGEGAYLYDITGKRYIDFLAGIAVNVLGHGYTPLVKAISEQAAKIIHVSNLYYTEPQATAAAKLVKLSGLDRAFFANSGAEANEGAIKIARKYAHQIAADKSQIITAWDSFHGRTLATLTATGQPKYQKGFEPLPAAFDYVHYNDIAELEEKISDKTCAVMLETIQGEGGVYPPKDDYLKKVRALCDRHGALLILDEIQAGIGRSGKFFAYEKYGVKPDIVTLAKGLAGGVPIGAFICTEKVAQAFHAGDHGTTFGGNPLACAAANVVLDTIPDEKFLAHVEEIGAYFKSKLLDLQKKHADKISEIRGEGLILGAQLTNVKSGTEIVSACLERGAIINCTAGTVLRFIPPLIITAEQVDAVTEILDAALSD